jgi:hypothetical protein
VLSSCGLIFRESKVFDVFIGNFKALVINHRPSALNVIISYRRNCSITLELHIQISLRFEFWPACLIGVLRMIWNIMATREQARTRLLRCRSHESPSSNYLILKTVHWKISFDSYHQQHEKQSVLHCEKTEKKLILASTLYRRVKNLFQIPKFLDYEKLKSKGSFIFSLLIVCISSFFFFKGFC